MMDPMAESWVADALQQAPVARLGTLGSDGAVRLVPICFAIVDAWLVSVVDDKAKRTTELRRLDDLEAGGSATVLVDHYDDDWSRLWWVAAFAARRSSTAGATTMRWRRSPPSPRIIPQYRRDPPEGAVYRIAMDEVRSLAPATVGSSGRQGPIPRLSTPRSLGEVDWQVGGRSVAGDRLGGRASPLIYRYARMPNGRQMTAAGIEWENRLGCQAMETVEPPRRARQ